MYMLSITGCNRLINPWKPQENKNGTLKGGTGHTFRWHHTSKYISKSNISVGPRSHEYHTNDFDVPGIGLWFTSYTRYLRLC